MIQKRREPTISAGTTFSYSKSFVHQSPIHRNGAQPQQNNFKCCSLPAMKPPCTTNLHLCWQSKPAESWPRLIFSVICHKEKYIITLVLLSYPCRSWLHIFEEEFWRWTQPPMGASIYLSCAERTEFQASMFSPALVLRQTMCCTKGISMGRSAPTCSVPQQYWCLLQPPPHWTMCLTSLLI